MKYLSVCSGIEAASVAWHPLGWTPVGFSEIEPFPCAILKHRFPNVPNYGSLTEYQSWPLSIGDVELLCGGTPCQSFSVGGRREGLEDPRGQLMFSFLGLAEKIKPKWIVWENVPGVLSSNGGRDFGSFLGALVKLGYGFAYRMLDAQHFRGTPQRRRRVFVVACRNPVTGLGDWRAAAEALSIGEGLRGYLEAGGKKRKAIASDSGSCIKGNSKYFDFQAIGQYGTDGSASTLMARDYKDSKDLVIEPVCVTGNKTHCLTSSHRGSEDGTGRGTPIINHPTVAFTPSSFAQYSEGIGTIRANGGDLGGGSEGIIVKKTAVRRLSTTECLRLQGFPDGWTQIPWKGKLASECPDGPQYKAIGNSWAVPCARWIGERINFIHGKVSS